ncbi:hypothetical protein BKA82DRAFT_4047732 [Pisolithus tinctorius]|nr:hypothetical protein BKA82DRAFT_4047732 [Pisolithus tinctorius]
MLCTYLHRNAIVHTPWTCSFYPLDARETVKRCNFDGMLLILWRFLWIPPVSYTTCAIVERLTNSPCTFYPAAAVFGSLLLTGVHTSLAPCSLSCNRFFIRCRRSNKMDLRCPRPFVPSASCLVPAGYLLLIPKFRSAVYQ